ncbi:MAG: helix-turn-helix transcriptional regulator [Bacteroides sp.]|nr:helix-turn-helix transcriptional regulator [Bacteroides sp.]
MNTNDKEHEFGDRLRALREEKGYSRKDMCELLYIGEKAYGKYEQGHRHPDITVLPKIAKKLNTTTDYLLSGFEPSKADQLCLLIKDYDEPMQEKIIDWLKVTLPLVFPKNTP